MTRPQIDRTWLIKLIEPSDDGTHPPSDITIIHGRDAAYYADRILDALGDGLLLTPAEHRAMDVTADLYNALAAITGQGPTRDADLSEIAHEIHHIQDRILAQAAARAFPDRYRLLGGQIHTNGASA